MNDTIITFDFEADTPPEADTVPAEQPISSFGSDGTANRNPVVRLRDDGREVVVVGRRDAVTIEVADDGQLLTCPAHTIAAEVTDPARQVELLRQALTTICRERSRTTADLEIAESATRHARQDHDRTLGEIREYAIEAHRRGDICRDGLDEFCRRFGMDQYRPRVRVQYTITGEVEIDREDETDAQEQLEDYLSLDFSQVDDALAGTGHFQLEVTDTEELE